MQDGPLTGIRVLEMGSTVAAPFCARLLADFGAEVVKVEPPEGDAVRSMGKRCHGTSLYAASIFRNKSLVSVDLRRPEGQEIARSIARKSDVVVENFRPGTLERWGLGWADLSRFDPRLVMVRISGFGQTGPYSQRPGYGVIGEAVSGLRHITGDPDRPPTRAATSLTDYITGLYAAFGAALALIARNRSGRGQCIDAALYEGAFSFIEPHVPAFAKLGVIANRAGSRLPDNVPNNLYATKDQNFIHIAAVGEAVFRRFAVAMGREDLCRDDRFATATARGQNAAELDDVIAAWTGLYSLDELETMLASASVPATRIFTIADIFGDPHYRARGMLVDAPHDKLDTVTVTGIVPKLSETPGRVRWAGRSVGSDTERVLSELLGLSAADISRLATAGVIASPPQR